MALEGLSSCAPARSSLMAVVGVLLAGQCPAAGQTAKLLYPDNQRLEKSFFDLGSIFELAVCHNCRVVIRDSTCLANDSPCQTPKVNVKESSCADRLSKLSKSIGSRQLSDAFATVSSLHTDTR
jgi:hypothetical protein